MKAIGELLCAYGERMRAKIEEQYNPREGPVLLRSVMYIKKRDYERPCRSEPIRGCLFK